MPTPESATPLQQILPSAVDSLYSRASAFGVSFMVIAALLHSLGSVFSKMVLLTFSVPQLALMRASLTLLTLLIVALIYFRRSLNLTWRELPALLGYGLAAMVISPLMFYSAIERVSVGVVLIIEYTAPILIIIWLRIIRGVKIQPAVLGGMLACIAGLALVAMPSDGVMLDGIGMLFGFGAAMALAGGYLLSERALKQRPAIIVSLLGYVAGTLVWIFLAQAWQFPLHLLLQPVGIANTIGIPSVAAFWLILIIAGPCTVISGLMVLQGIKLLGPARASVVSMVEPVFSAAIAWVLLSEYLSTLQIVGGVLALLSLIYLEGPWRQRASSA